MMDEKCQQAWQWTLDHLEDGRRKSGKPAFTLMDKDLLMIGFYQGWHQNQARGIVDGREGLGPDVGILSPGWDAGSSASAEADTGESNALVSDVPYEMP